MVMETPGPQEVGREFVRQYYTMLHHAPHYLHRFYSNDSALVHGGVEKAGSEQPAVTGQQNIHKKIVSLNFCDCHAKIRQVDCQSTVSKSVVVQVTGELSNNGEPMRRFMQTFVLVPQSAKQFYLHNDIFRYQDEVFQEDEGETEDSDQLGFSTDTRTETFECGATIQESAPSVPSESAPSFESAPLSNGSVHEEEQEDIETPPQPTKPEPESSSFAENDSGVSEEPHAEPEYEPKQEIKSEQVNKPDTVDFPELATETSNKPVSWAALASKNTPAGVPAPTSSAFPAPQPHPSSKPPPPRQPEQPAKVTEEKSAPAPQPERPQRQSREPMPAERVKNSTGGQGDSFNNYDVMNGRRSNSSGGGGGSMQKFPDCQQLFVGNLPHDISECDLKHFFEEFGPVEEMRINTKSGKGNVPNFGFVCFKHPGTVQKILKIKTETPHIKFNDHRLNVEEKKPRGSEGMRGRGMSRGGTGGQGPGRSGNSYGNGPSGRGSIKSGGDRAGFGRSEIRPYNAGGGRGGSRH